MLRLKGGRRLIFQFRCDKLQVPSMWKHSGSARSSRDIGNSALPLGQMCCPWICSKGGVYWYIIGSVTCSTNPDRRVAGRTKLGGPRRGEGPGQGADGLPGHPVKRKMDLPFSNSYSFPATEHGCCTTANAGASSRISAWCLWKWWLYCWSRRNFHWTIWLIDVYRYFFRQKLARVFYKMLS